MSKTVHPQNIPLALALIVFGTLNYAAMGIFVKLAQPDTPTNIILTSVSGFYH